MENEVKGRYKSLTQIEKVDSDARPSDVQKALKGVTYPASKQDLLKHAKGQGADGGVLDLIDKMPDGKYENMADVMKGVGKSG